MKQIAADIAIQKRFLMAGARVLSSTPEEAIAFAAKERAMWKDVVALSGCQERMIRKVDRFRRDHAIERCRARRAKLC